MFSMGAFSQQCLAIKTNIINLVMLRIISPQNLFYKPDPSSKGNYHLLFNYSRNTQSSVVYNIILYAQL